MAVFIGTSRLSDDTASKFSVLLRQTRKLKNHHAIAAPTSLPLVTRLLLYQARSLLAASFSLGVPFGAGSLSNRCSTQTHCARALCCSNVLARSKNTQSSTQLTLRLWRTKPGQLRQLGRVRRPFRKSLLWTEWQKAKSSLSMTAAARETRKCCYAFCS